LKSAQEVVAFRAPTCDVPYRYASVVVLTLLLLHPI
jgi:hypothetical protein